MVQREKLNEKLTVYSDYAIEESVKFGNDLRDFDSGGWRIWII